MKFTRDIFSLGAIAIAMELAGALILIVEYFAGLTQWNMFLYVPLILILLGLFLYIKSLKS